MADLFPCKGRCVLHELCVMGCFVCEAMDIEVRCQGCGVRTGGPDLCPRCRNAAESEHRTEVKR